MSVPLNTNKITADLKLPFQYSLMSDVFPINLGFSWHSKMADN